MDGNLLLTCKACLYVLLACIVFMYRLHTLFSCIAYMLVFTYSLLSCLAHMHYLHAWNAILLALYSYVYLALPCMLRVRLASSKSRDA